MATKPLAVGGSALTAQDQADVREQIGAVALTTAQTTAGGINVPALTSGNVLLDASGATIATFNGTTTITFPGLTYAPFFVATGYVVTPTVYIESNTGFLAFGSSQDARMYYGGANQIEQRNGTASQTKRVFGTWTDASNGRWLNITMSTAGVAAITPTGNGTGASGNRLELQGDVRFTAAGEFAHYTTATRPAFGNGKFIFDDDLDKLLIGGVSGWEVVTST